jgi:hypothetical protein
MMRCSGMEIISEGPVSQITGRTYCTVDIVGEKFITFQLA